MKKISTFLFAAALFLGMLTLTLKELRNWQLGGQRMDPVSQTLRDTTTLVPRQEVRETIPTNLHASRETAITNAIGSVSPAVVGISVVQIRYSQSPIMSDPFWRFMLPGTPLWFQEKVSSVGSGFIYDSDGFIITNAHVVENAIELTVTLADGQQQAADLIGIDEKTDLALIKIRDGGNYPIVNLGDSDDILMGEWVVAIGNPFGLFSESRMPIATAGIISSLNMDFGFQQSGRVYQDMIQTDASINSGNSGGPLVNSQGEVIGINTFIFSGNNNSGSIGIGFAMPINRATDIIAELRSKGFVERNYSTGMVYHNNDARTAQLFRLPSTTGVLVIGVKAESPAERGGIVVGDLILGVDGQVIANTDDIFAYFIAQNLKSGDQLVLNLIRDGQRRDIPITLTPVPE